MASRALPYNVLSVKQISCDRASSCVRVPCALEVCTLRAREAKSVRYAGKAGMLRHSVDANAQRGRCSTKKKSISLVQL